MAIKSNMKALTPARLRLKQDITLLSHGFSAPEAFPDGKCTVYPWDSTVDEVVLDLAGKGLSDETILFDLLPKLADLNGCPSDKFVFGDVNTVLLVSRALSRNSKIVYDFECPKCKGKEKSSLMIPEQLEKKGEKSKEYPGYDIVTLPICGDVVKMRPLLVGDARGIVSRNQASKSKISDKVMDMVAGIVAVNDTQADSLDELHTYYLALHPQDLAYLELQKNEITPHLSTTIKHQCAKCQHVVDHALPINTEFFRSGYVPSE
jgi:hypothetical protein